MDFGRKQHAHSLIICGAGSKSPYPVRTSKKNIKINTPILTILCFIQSTFLSHMDLNQDKGFKMVMQLPFIHHKTIVTGQLKRYRK